MKLFFFLLNCAHQAQTDTNNEPEPEPDTNFEFPIQDRTDTPCADFVVFMDRCMLRMGDKDSPFTEALCEPPRYSRQYYWCMLRNMDIQDCYPASTGYGDAHISCSPLALP